MTARNDGGSAFPVDFTIPDGAPVSNNGGPLLPAKGTQRFVNQGMSLRDYFAGEALTALIAQPLWQEGMTGIAFRLGGGGNDEAANFAKAAFAIADAMLLERAK